MRDQQSISRLQLLHPEVRLIFKKFIEDCENAFNITIRIVQGLRTFEEQQSIYDQGRIKPGKIITNARPEQSYHTWGFAVDIVPLDSKGKPDWNFDFKRFKQFMPDSMVWGADWDHDGKTKADGDKDEHLVDGDHYQVTFGLNWRDMFTKYQKRDFIKDTKYINILK